MVWPPLTHQDVEDEVDLKASSAALSAHEADTTAVHGIADTTVLATDAEVASAVATHAADTTSVHGITDTTVLATDAEVASAISTHEAAADPHTGYLTESAASAAYAPITQGIIGVASVTTDQGGVTTLTDLTGLSVTFTSTGNRRIGVRFHGNVESTIAGDFVMVQITDGSGTLLALGQVRLSAAGGQEVCPVSASLVPGAGSVTMKARMARSSGSGAATLKGATSNATLIVEDLGPS